MPQWLRKTIVLLVDITVVIVFITLALFYFGPRAVGNPGPGAKYATLKGGLHEIRNAIEQFQADTGAYPQKLSDLVATSAPTKGVDLKGKELPINVKQYRGPYLTWRGGIDNSGFPINPYQMTKATGDLDKDIAAHWCYSNGIVRAAVPTSGMTLDNIPYQSL